MPKRRKFPPGRCVHCLKQCAVLTGDHVIPAAWYPETTPANVEKWQAPSCAECNGALGCIEDRVLRDLRFAMDPNAVEGFGVANKAVRSVDPNQARDARDRRARTRAREELREKLEHGSRRPVDILLHSSLNEIEPSAESPPMRGPNAEDLEIVFTKIAKGLVWALCDGAFVEADQRIEVQPAGVGEPDLTSREWRWLLHTRGGVYTRGPGVTVRIMASPEFQKKAIEIVLWNSFAFLVFISPKESPALVPDQYTLVRPEEWIG